MNISLNVSSENADTCCKAVGMETEGGMLHRSKVTLNHEEGLLNFKVDAVDLTALRASMNTYLRWIDMCINLIGDD